MKLERLCPVPLPPELDVPVDVVIGKVRRSDVDAAVARHIGPGALWVGDPRTLAAATRVLEGDAGDEPLVLPDHPHADDENVARVEGEIRARDASGVVAVGSGTVNDIAKMAATRTAKPYVAIGTAASMNGYSSGIAAILSGGLKTTVAARPPRAILLDAQTLVEAPAELARAGLGDLLSKPVSTADWWLGDRVEGTGFSEEPGRLVDHAVEEASARASGLREGDPRAYEALGRALVLSGVSMVLAGSSSPASGGEHLLSHLWDMEALAEGSPTRLHGAQVGVATCISAAIYARVMELAEVSLPAPPTREEVDSRVRRDHASFVDAVLPQAVSKWERAAARRRVLERAWPEIRSGLAELGLPTPSETRSILERAGAPSTLAELGLAREDARRVLLRARDIRDRFTILDLAFELGVFPGAVDEVLDASGV